MVVHEGIYTGHVRQTMLWRQVNVSTVYALAGTAAASGHVRHSNDSVLQRAIKIIIDRQNDVKDEDSSTCWFANVT